MPPSVANPRRAPELALGAGPVVPGAAEAVPVVPGAAEAVPVVPGGAEAVLVVGAGSGAASARSISASLRTPPGVPVRLSPTNRIAPRPITVAMAAVATQPVATRIERRPIP
ncbi:hypothetical protein PSN01_04929 [Micromonospora saelicesensis]|nr:hypothetical protein PSN01_04929 [Micromonospora saelicesensis]